MKCLKSGDDNLPDSFDMFRMERRWGINWHQASRYVTCTHMSTLLPHCTIIGLLHKLCVPCLFESTFLKAWMLFLWSCKACATKKNNVTYSVSMFCLWGFAVAKIQQVSVDNIIWHLSECSSELKIICYSSYHVPQWLLIT